MDIKDDKGREEEEWDSYVEVDMVMRDEEGKLGSKQGEKKTRGKQDSLGVWNHV